MSLAQAKATGKIVVTQTGACATADFKDSPLGPDQWAVTISQKYGVVLISASAAAKTPEGIQDGSTLAAAKAAYPDLRQGPDMYSAPVPANPKALYSLQSDNGKVAQLALISKTQDCFN